MLSFIKVSSLSTFSRQKGYMSEYERKKLLVELVVSRSAITYMKYVKICINERDDDEDILHYHTVSNTLLKESFL